MATATARGSAFDPLLDHNSLLLEASLDDFVSPSPSPSPSPGPGKAIGMAPFGYPSVHSGFRSESELEGSDSEEASAGGYSPPAWRRLGNGDRSSGFWRKGEDELHHQVGMMTIDDSRFDRESSLEYGYYESADEGDDFIDDGGVLAQAIRTRLPTGSLSPEKERSPEPPERYQQQQHQHQQNGIFSRKVLGLVNNNNNNEETTVKIKVEDEEPTGRLDERILAAPQPPPPNNGFSVGLATDDPVAADNYFRFAVRAEVQQRTEPIEAAVRFLRSTARLVAGSWSSFFVSCLVAVLSYAAMRSLFQPASMRRPVPDLVKVAGVARAFEPLIHYSENGVQQVGDLQATGVAVWDLSESVRSSNLTSAPIIVKELDDLSESLKTLAIELTKFFANVDGDIDGYVFFLTNHSYPGVTPNHNHPY